MRIGLVDCNNFFVSCERLFRPDLQSKPTLVLSANDGCVVARSQEVKDIGIPMGVPYFKIKDIIKDKDIQVFSGNIILYRDISRRVFDIVRKAFATVEQYSIDEAFFTGDAEEISQDSLQMLQAKVWQEVGIPISIGLADSKTLAKIATDIAKKKSGVCMLHNKQWSKLSPDMPLGSVWGIGRGLVEQYRRHGLKTVADLLAVDPSLLCQRFGIVSARQHAELSGIAVHTLTKERPLQQSLMSSRSFKKTTTDMAVLADATAYHVRHIAADLRSMQAVAKIIRVSIQPSRHGDFFLQGGSSEAILEQGTSDTIVLLQAASRLLEHMYTREVPYQKVSVTVSGISTVHSVQNTLFSQGTESRGSNELYTAIDALNKDNNELVVLGSRLQEKAWQPKAEKRSFAYTTRWNEICQVSATMPHSNISDICT